MLFGAFGAISAARRAGRARAIGVSGDRYWKAFGLTFVLSNVATLLAWAMFLGVAYMLNSGPEADRSANTITADRLEQSIGDYGDYKAQTARRSSPHRPRAPPTPPTRSAPAPTTA